MKHASMQVARMILALLVTFAVTPAFASAATDVSTRTVQLLPPGGTMCQQMTVTSVTPYIYDGALNSFDVVVPDRNYVAIGGSVGNTVISFRYMVRGMTPDGQLRTHVDIDSTAVGKGLPVSLTLLSAHDGLTCATTVAFTVTGNGVTTPITTPIPTPTGATGQGSGSTTHTTPPAPKPVTPTKAPSAPRHATAPIAPQSTSTASSTGATTTVTSAITNAALGICTGSHSYQLWFVLLALFIVLSALAALAKPPLAQRNPAIPVALVLVPLILFVGFWYLVPGCRAANWIPIVLLIVAIAGLLAAFREEKTTAILLPSSQPKPQPPVVTTAPATTKTSAVATPTTSTTPAGNKGPTPAAVNAAQKFSEAKNANGQKQPQKAPQQKPQANPQPVQPKPQQGGQQQKK